MLLGSPLWKRANELERTNVNLVSHIQDREGDLRIVQTTVSNLKGEMQGLKARLKSAESAAASRKLKGMMEASEDLGKQER